MSEIVSEPSALDYGKSYTYADYLTWHFKARMEILKGRLFKMSPAPSKAHQIVSREIGGIFYNFFKQRSCHMFVAPFDVRLITRGKNNHEIDTVFQPDLCVICDEKKLDNNGCLGAPDLIVEILSPGNSKKEIKYKFDIYEESGVREYWIVDYSEFMVLQYVLQNGKFVGSKPLSTEDKCQSHIFPELIFDISEIFEGV